MVDALLAKHSPAPPGAPVGLGRPLRGPGHRAARALGAGHHWSSQIGTTSPILSGPRGKRHTFSGSTDEGVGQAVVFSWVSLRSIGPQESMTRPRAAPKIRHQVRSFDSLPLLRPLDLRRAA